MIWREFSIHFPHIETDTRMRHNRKVTFLGLSSVVNFTDPQAPASHGGHIHSTSRYGTPTLCRSSARPGKWRIKLGVCP